MQNLGLYFLLNSVHHFLPFPERSFFLDGILLIIFLMSIFHSKPIYSYQSKRTPKYRKVWALLPVTFWVENVKKVFKRFYLFFYFIFLFTFQRVFSTIIRCLNLKYLKLTIFLISYLIILLFFHTIIIIHLSSNVKFMRMTRMKMYLNHRYLSKAMIDHFHKCFIIIQFHRLVLLSTCLFLGFF